VHFQTCTDAADGVIRLPKVDSYALEEPRTKAGKRKLAQEVTSIIADISSSFRAGAAK
jgi:hypothetical protein